MGGGDGIGLLKGIQPRTDQDLGRGVTFRSFLSSRSEPLGRVTTHFRDRLTFLVLVWFGGIYHAVYSK